MEAIQNSSQVNLDPLRAWGPAANYYSQPLQLSMSIPNDWHTQQTPNIPLRLVAPPRGNPPFTVYIDVFCKPAPVRSKELLASVAELNFAQNADPSKPEFFASPTTPLPIGNISALMKRYSWTETVSGYTAEMRQMMVVLQPFNMLYIIKLMTRADLTELTMTVFQKMLATLTFSDSNTEKPKMAPVPEVKAAVTPTEPPTRTFENGRWRKRKRD